jgi:hypothetical protein
LKKARSAIHCQRTKAAGKTIFRKWSRLPHTFKMNTTPGIIDIILKLTLEPLHQDDAETRNRNFFLCQKRSYKKMAINPNSFFIFTPF